MINFLRTASILDNLGCYKLSDKFTKIAIDQSDLDFDTVYRDPLTYSDFVLNKRGKIFVLGISNTPNFKADSHLAEVCELVGVKPHNIIDHIIINSLKL